MPSLLSYSAGMKHIIDDHAQLGSFQSQIPPMDEGQLLPVILISCIDGRELEHLSGLSDMGWSLMQISVCDRIYDLAFQYRSQIVSTLSVFSGTAVANLGVDRITDFRYRELYLEKTEVWQLILRCQVWWIPS